MAEENEKKSTVHITSQTHADFKGWCGNNGRNMGEVADKLFKGFILRTKALDDAEKNNDWKKISLFFYYYFFKFFKEIFKERKEKK